ncbi:MAG: hypothetical protein NVS4B12_21970 [Ktedonobacteraceae bacterium]
MHRIHIIGGTGSGKTTLARKLGTRLGIPFHDLDEIGYEGGFGAPRPLNVRLAELKRIADLPAWVTEGGYILWIDELLRMADTIVWLDLPWRIRRWRIITRHIKADLAHTNRHSGYLNLYRFYKTARKYERNPIVYTLQASNSGDYSSRATVIHYLERYKDKVVQCRTVADVTAFEKRVILG